MDVAPRGAGAGVTRPEPAAQRGERGLHGGCGPRADMAGPSSPNSGHGGARAPLQKGESVVKKISF